MTILIINGIVNTILVDTNASHCAEVYGGQWLDVPDNIEIGIGWTWDGEKFMPPETKEGE
jgi:hypothetical protein